MNRAPPPASPPSETSLSSTNKEKRHEPPAVATKPPSNSSSRRRRLPPPMQQPTVDTKSMRSLPADASIPSSRGDPPPQPSAGNMACRQESPSISISSSRGDPPLQPNARNVHGGNQKGRRAAGRANKAQNSAQQRLSPPPPPQEPSYRGRARGRAARGDANRGRGNLNNRGRRGGRAPTEDAQSMVSGHSGRGDLAQRGRARGGGRRGGRGRGRGGADRSNEKNRIKERRGNPRARRGRGRRDGGRGGRAISATKWCCSEEQARKKPIYFELFEKEELNPCMLTPRLLCGGSIFGKSLFMPDRRGLARIHTSCRGMQQKKKTDSSHVLRCIGDIAEFICKYMESKPTRLTCRVDQIESKRMHWHIHYKRNDWKKIIEQDNDMNIHSEDIDDAAQFFKVIEMVDVFKHCYAKHGFFEYHHQEIIHIDIGRNDDDGQKQKKKRVSGMLGEPDDDEKENAKMEKTANGDNDDDDAKDVSKADKELEEALKRPSEEEALRKLAKDINDRGFQFSSMECRIRQEMKTQDADNRISLKAEIINCVKMAIELKHKVDGEYFFKDQRMGIDFESRSIFVEIRPRAYFRIYPESIASFQKKLKGVQKNRFKLAEKELKEAYGEERVHELSEYAERYFKKHPELFEWHKTRH